MVARGVYFALTDDQERKLLAAEDNDDVLAMVEEIEEAWDEPWLAETDKAWDAMHRCLSDGSLKLDAGEYPLSYAVMGGAQLCDSGDYYVCYVTAADVLDVADALQSVDETWLRQRYDTLSSTDYVGPHNDDDFDYTWQYLQNARSLYERAAGAGRAVIFTVDQ